MVLMIAVHWPFAFLRYLSSLDEIQLLKEVEILSIISLAAWLFLKIFGESPSMLEVTSTRRLRIFPSAVSALGFTDGARLGVTDGLNDGALLGTLVGIKLGLSDGSIDGVSDGVADGVVEGLAEGMSVVGEPLGTFEGIAEGYWTHE